MRHSTGTRGACVSCSGPVCSDRTGGLITTMKTAELEMAPQRPKDTEELGGTTTEDSTNRGRLCRRVPPHMLLVYWALKVCGSLQEFLARFKRHQLQAILFQLEAELSRQRDWPDWLWKVLREQMAQKLGDLILNTQLRDRYSKLLDRPVGELTLEDFLKASDDACTALTYWVKYAEAADLIGRYLDGDEYAFAHLKIQATWLLGVITIHVKNDSDQEDVAQDAWARIAKVVKDYDPARASFQTFAKSWIGYAIAEYKRKKGKFPLLIDDLDEKDFEKGESLTEELNRNECYEAFLEALKSVCHGDSPLHEKVALLYGLILQWRQSEIWDRLAKETFATLLPRLQSDLIEQVPWTRDYVRELLVTMHRDIIEGLTVEETLRNKKTRRHYGKECFGDLLKRPVGAIRLIDYCRAGIDQRGFSSDFTNWVS